MGITHFENGKDQTINYVNTGVSVNDINHKACTAALASDAFQVPANKKWTIYRIGGYRAVSGDIDIYLIDPVFSYGLLKSVINGTQIHVTEPFTISSGWKVQVHHKTAGVGTIDSFVLYNEEPE